MILLKSTTILSIVQKKIKPKDLSDSVLVEYVGETNKKDPKFKIRDHVRISKYKNIFSKGYLPDWSEEFFIINKV